MWDFSMLTCLCNLDMPNPYHLYSKFGLIGIYNNHILFRNTDGRHTLKPSNAYGSKSISILCHANKHYTTFFSCGN